MQLPGLLGKSPGRLGPVVKFHRPTHPGDGDMSTASGDGGELRRSAWSASSGLLAGNACHDARFRSEIHWLLQPFKKRFSADLAPDGERFLMLTSPEQPSSEEGSVHVTFLLNFFDELRRRVPVK